MQPNEFPKTWLINPDWNPNEHLMQLQGRDYLNVQNRLLWFIKEQRELIATGLARMPYIVQTDLVEMDKQTSWAHFKTYVRDVLGNEATMYGSESAKDFKDFAEKASTKSLGRALLALGYGTAFAPEMDEGERVVDSPVERKTPPPATTAPASATTSGDTAKRQPASPQPRTQPKAKVEEVATDGQRAAIRKLATALGVSEPEVTTAAQAREEIQRLTREYQAHTRHRETGHAPTTTDDGAALHQTLQKRLKDSEGLQELYDEAGKYGLKGEQFFKELLTVTKLPSGALAQPLSAAAIKPMKKYVADMAKEAQAAAARTPDLATVATPRERP